MGSLEQPTPVAEERDSSRLIIGIAVAVVIAAALAAAFLLRQPPKAVKTVSPYIASLTLSDFKIDPPSLLTLPVKNEIPVRVEMTWRREK